MWQATPAAWCYRVLLCTFDKCADCHNLCLLHGLLLLLAGCLQFHGNRNDQYGARSDYIFVGDAADYAVKLQQLQQYQQDTRQQDLALLPAPQQQPPQQLQQPSLQGGFSISLLSALSSAFILRVSIPIIPVGAGCNVVRCHAVKTETQQQVYRTAAGVLQLYKMHVLPDHVATIGGWCMHTCDSKPGCHCRPFLCCCRSCAGRTMRL